MKTRAPTEPKPTQQPSSPCEVAQPASSSLPSRMAYLPHTSPARPSRHRSAQQQAPAQPRRALPAPLPDPAEQGERAELGFGAVLNRKVECRGGRGGAFKGGHQGSRRAGRWARGRASRRGSWALLARWGRKGGRGWRRQVGPGRQQ